MTFYKIIFGFIVDFSTYQTPPQSFPNAPSLPVFFSRQPTLPLLLLYQDAWLQYQIYSYFIIFHNCMTLHESCNNDTAIIFTNLYSKLAPLTSSATGLLLTANASSGVMPPPTLTSTGVSWFSSQTPLYTGESPKIQRIAMSFSV